MMNKIKFYNISVLFFTVNNLAYATETMHFPTEILQISVEEESECTSAENIELFKKIEQEQQVKIECVVHDGHIYGEELRVMAGRKTTFIGSIQYFFKDLYYRITLKKDVIEGQETSYSEEESPLEHQIELQEDEIYSQELAPPITETDNSTLIEESPIYLQNYPLNIDSETSFTIVETFFATDRATATTKSGIPDRDPYKQFSNEIYQGTSAYQLGVATVSIPKNKQPGISSKPGFLTFNPQPEHHTVLWNNQIIKPAQFFKTIQQNPNKKSFIFIHGYNVSFSKAAIQTAELTYDLQFTGTPIFYSWPSKAKLLGYFADRETLELSQEKFSNFINEYLKEAPQELYLIAHSMGSQALLETLEQQLPNNPQLQKHLKGIIFVAPDVATQKFNTTVQKLSKFNIPITLYGSQKDLALAVSQSISAQQRAGYLKPIDEMVKVKGLDVIDATDVRTDFLGHALSPVSTDMSELMIHKIHAKLRTKLKAILHQHGTYYMLKAK